MNASNVRISTGDNVEISATHYCAAEPSSRLVAMVLGATGAQQETYADIASFLARDGWHVLTFDYRGIGRSKIEPCDRDKLSMSAWGKEDLAAVIDWVCETFGPERVVAIAHSIGGQILPLAPNHGRIDAVLAVGVQKGFWKLWDGPTKFLVYAFFRLYLPVCARVLGYAPLGFVGLDRLERQIALDFSRWTLNLDYVNADGQSFTDRFADFSAPILALSFEDDEKAPKRAVDFLMRHYYLRAATFRCHLVPREYGLKKLGHSGFFDGRVFPESIWRETSSWLKRAAPPQRNQGFHFKALKGVTRAFDKEPLSVVHCRRGGAGS